MAEAKLTIGARSFRVACEDGQEGYLQSAAGLLDQFAKSINNSGDKLGESQLLLMSGLMAADQAKALERENLNLQAYHKDLEARLSKLENKAGSAVETARNESRKELDEAKARLAETQKELKDNQDLLEASKQKNDASQKALDEYKLALENLQANRGGDEAPRSVGNTQELQNRLLELEAQNTKLHNESSRRDALIQTLEKEIQSLKNINSETDNVIKTEDETNQDMMNDLLKGLERLAGD